MTPTKEQIEAAHDFVSEEFWGLCLTALKKGFLDDYSATDEILKIEDMLANLLAKREAQAHAAGVREGVERLEALYAKQREICAKDEKDPWSDCTKEILEVNRKIRALIEENK